MKRGRRARKDARPRPCVVASLVIWKPLWVQIKRRAAAEGISASALIARLIADYLGARAPRPGRKGRHSDETPGH